MALSFRFPGHPASEAELAVSCRCLDALGTQVHDAYHTARRYGLAVAWLEGSRIEAEVEGAINAGCPVLANIHTRTLPYYQLSQEAMTSVLIVGIDNQYVFLHDPEPLLGGPYRKVKRVCFFSGWANSLCSAYRVYSERKGSQL